MTLQEITALLQDPSYYQHLDSFDDRFAHFSFSNKGLKKISHLDNSDSYEDEHIEFQACGTFKLKMPDFKAKCKYSQSRKQEQFRPSKLLTRLMEP